MLRTGAFRKASSPHSPEKRTRKSAPIRTPRAVTSTLPSRQSVREVPATRVAIDSSRVFGRRTSGLGAEQVLELRRGGCIQKLGAHEPLKERCAIADTSTAVPCGVKGGVEEVPHTGVLFGLD